MPSIIVKCKLFRIKYTTVSEGETFLRNKHKIEFFEIKCTFFGRKENTISALRNGTMVTTSNMLQSGWNTEKKHQQRKIHQKLQ